MTEPIIDIQNVTKSYQTGAPVLRDVSLGYTQRFIRHYYWAKWLR